MLSIMRESAIDKAIRILQAGIGVKAGIDEVMAAGKMLRQLPPGMPVAVVREAWRWCIHFPTVYHTLRRTPDEHFELTVAGLEAWKSPASTFFRAVLAVDRSPAALRAANQAFAELGNQREPYAPSGRKRIEAVMKEPIYARAAEAACKDHWSHPRPIYPGEKGWKKGAKNIGHAGIVRGICECGGVDGDVFCFFRALVYEGGPESASTLRLLFKRSKPAIDLARFAKSPQMLALFGQSQTTPRAKRRHSSRLPSAR
jgi:hypothetical protein